MTTTAHTSGRNCGRIIGGGAKDRRPEAGRYASAAEAAGQRQLPKRLKPVRAGVYGSFDVEAAGTADAFEAAAASAAACFAAVRHQLRMPHEAHFGARAVQT